MQFSQLLSTLKTYEKTSYLYEGLTLEESRSVKLWENAGISLKEAALTPDQIQQLFKSIEQGATDAGGNRTLLGKGKDAAAAVNTAWEDLKTKIQNSGPIQNVDSAYDSAVAKIEAGLGGPDNAVNKIIQKYRTFAKEHPIAQGFIYSALIAAAGISGAGLGGAAVLGLLKMADKLLQGEKFSSAAYSGAKTGAAAYGASKLGDYIKGKMAGDQPVPADAAAPETPQATSGQSRIINKPEDFGSGLDQFGQEQLNAVRSRIADDPEGVSPSLQRLLDRLSKGELKPGELDALTRQRDNYVRFLNSPGGDAAANLKLWNGTQLTGADAMAAARKQFDILDKTISVAQSIKESKSFNLSESQISVIFAGIVVRQLDEGVLDSIKGAVGKAAGWAATKGKNLTTKVTADKLNSAWQAAGSPTDSEEVKKVIVGTGVDATVVDKAFTDAGVQSAAPADTPASDDTTTAPTTPVDTATEPAKGEEPPATPAATQQSKVGVGQINKIVPTLRVRDLKSVQKTVDTTLAKRGQTTQPTAEGKYAGFYSKFLGKEI